MLGSVMFTTDIFSQRKQNFRHFRLQYRGCLPSRLGGLDFGSGTQPSNPGSPVRSFQSPNLSAACTDVSNTRDTEDVLVRVLGSMLYRISYTNEQYKRLHSVPASCTPYPMGKKYKCNAILCEPSSLGTFRG